MRLRRREENYVTAVNRKRAQARRLAEDALAPVPEDGVAESLPTLSSSQNIRIDIMLMTLLTESTSSKHALNVGDDTASGKGSMVQRA